MYVRFELYCVTGCSEEIKQFANHRHVNRSVHVGIFTEQLESVMKPVTSLPYSLYVRDFLQKISGN